MSYDQRPGELKGVDKAAALLLTLSAEESVNVFRCIDAQ
jgi:flagellar motor switch protein FliG